MANYIPNYQKKQRILEDKEDALRRAVAGGAKEKEEDLLIAAETVRLARIRALRARRQKISPADVPELRQQIARIDAKIEIVAATTAAEVLAEFRVERVTKAKA